MTFRAHQPTRYVRLSQDRVAAGMMDLPKDRQVSPQGKDLAKALGSNCIQEGQPLPRRETDWTGPPRRLPGPTPLIFGDPGSFSMHWRPCARAQPTSAPGTCDS